MIGKNYKEKAFVNRLEEHFNNNGWTVKREVTSDDSRDRADMIIYKSGIGFIGIEAKIINIRNGGIIGKTIKQIIRYKKQSWCGKEIKLWVGAIKSNIEYSDYSTRGWIDVSSVITNTLLNEFGIGSLSGIKWIGTKFESDTKLKMDFCCNENWATIPIKFPSSSYYPQVNKIIEVIKKREVYDN